MSEREILSSYVYTIVASLVQNGVEQVVVSPGSRSTPLAYAFAHTKEIKMFRQVDERAAAFFALGLAKSTGKPVVLLCTSGTAAANYFPAIVEAKYARVPLIIMTADRPHELREVGAPQAINQIHLYGEQVKWFAEFPIPDDAKSTLPFIERHTARAVAIAMSAPYGPVHINVPFREPLLIDFCDLPKLRYQGNILNDGSLSEEAKHVLQNAITETRKGIFIVGELALNTDVDYIWALIRRAKWPVIVESLSNMRGNIPEDCLPYVISTYDAILKNAAFKNRIAPTTVIRFGAQPVSKFLSNFIAESNPENYIIVDEDPMFRDSTSMATSFIHAKLDQSLAHLAVESNIDASYVALWQQGQKIASKHIEHYIENEHDEGALVGEMLQAIPQASDIFTSNSMPIRDIDTFYMPSEKNIRIIANRGANGIDGIVSTALGYSSGNARHTYLLIGDLAFLHDSNAFLATRYQTCELTIIVMNNDGGGIFSYLPQSTVENHYEDLFGTPTGLTFEHVAAMYDLHYTKVTEPHTFGEAIQAPNEKPVRLIEVFTNRDENVATHRKLWQAINAELDAWLQ